MIWLELHYKKKSFDYRVKDVDAIQILDLLDDIEETSIKQDVLLPNVYDMVYKSGNRKIYIKDDKSLMDMFTNLQGVETIDIWLHDTKTPIKEFDLLAGLRKQRKEEVNLKRGLEQRLREEEQKKEQKKRVEEENLREEADELGGLFSPLVMEVPVLDIETNVMGYVRLFGDRVAFGDEPQSNPSKEIPHTTGESPQIITDIPTQTQKPTQNHSQKPILNHSKKSASNQAESTQSSPTKENSQFNQNQNKPCPTDDRFSSQPIPPSKTPKTTPNHPLPSKKIPKSTARRKGIFVSKGTKSSDQSGEGSNNVKLKRSDNISFVNIGSGSDTDSMDNDYVDSEGSESESDYSSSDGSSEEEEIHETYSNTVSVMHPFDTGSRIEGDEVDGDLDLLGSTYRNGKMYISQPWGQISLAPWLLFMTKEDFLHVLSDFCIHKGFYIVVLKSDRQRYTGECYGEKCTWRIHASRLPDGVTWAIKSIFGEHIDCFFQKNNPMATVSWMSKKLELDLRAQPNMPVETMVQTFMDRFAINVARRTMYKVRIAASNTVHGVYEDSYKFLAAYAEMIKKTNPGSHALITWHKPNNDAVTHFKAMFVCYNAWIKGFMRGCRPFIGVDGCFLKGRYKGMLLTALSLDGNNQQFVIAYAVVAKENTETWLYVFRNLRFALQQEGCVKWDWTFISDRMKGVERALDKEFPRAEKRICAYHMYTNFKERWSGPLYHDLFWQAANATSLSQYKKALGYLSKKSKAAMEYVSNVPQQWSKHQFEPAVACDHNTSNFVESFNAVIKEIREQPVLAVMEGIRRYVMDKIAERMDIADEIGMSNPTPYAKEKLAINSAASSHCKVIKAGGGEFEVQEDTNSYPVDLQRGTCMCGEWQISGIPCRHACRAIYHNKEEPTHFLNSFYSGELYNLTYAEHMHPIPDKDQWPSFEFPDVLPPIQERSIGRPAKQRKRKSDEPRKGKRSTTLRCSICKTLGHNARSCQGGPTAKQRKATAAAQKSSNGYGSGVKKTVAGGEVGADFGVKKTAAGAEVGAGSGVKKTAGGGEVGAGSGVKKRASGGGEGSIIKKKKTT